MKSIIFALGVILLFGQCKKVPEREFIQIRAVSIDGSALQEGQGIELNYGDEADVVFEFQTNSPLDSVYIKMIDNYKIRISDSDNQNITTHPEAGDTKGSFTYHIETQSQFDPPIGNSISDSKAIQIVMLNESGTVKVYSISVLVQ